MKPNFIKEMQGTLENSRVKTGAMLETVNNFDPPKEYTKFQKGLWSVICKYLSDNGQLTANEVIIIDDYCWIREKMKEAKEKTKAVVVSITNNKNKTNPTKNPYLAVFIELRREAGQIERQLGIGVLNRDKISWKPKHEMAGEIDDGIK